MIVPCAGGGGGGVEGGGGGGVARLSPRGAGHPGGGLRLCGQVQVTSKLLVKMLLG